jgi:hypothetical protein
MKEDPPRRRLVAIHGVGPARPGQIVAELADGLGVKATPGASTDQPYPRLVPADGPFWEIAEVNWSDLMAPRRTPWGVLRHVFLIMTAMLAIAEHWHRRLVPGRRLDLARAYCWSYQFTMPWVVILGAVVLVGVAVEEPWLRGALLFGTVTSSVFLAKWLGRWSQPFRSARYWLIPICAVGLVLSLDRHESVLAGACAVSSYVYLFSQGGCSLLLLLTVLSLVFRARSVPWEQRLSCAALLYVPFFGLAALGILAGVAALQFAHQFPGYGLWLRLMVVRYDLQWVELVTTLAVSLLGVGGLLIAAAYVQRSRRDYEANESSSGPFARNGLFVLLVITPIVLLATGACYAWSLLDYGVLDPRRYEGDVLDVYRVSALRVLPYLPFLFGPLAIITDVVGDVAFFLHPDEKNPMSVRRACRDRLRAVLRASPAGSGSAPIGCILVAHSQGSVVAFDELLADLALAARVQLVTLGSPLESLYGRFLGWNRLGLRGGLGGVHWLNAFRAGDYIGGRIGAPASNQPLGPGGHTGYWADREVARLLEHCAGALPAAPASEARASANGPERAAPELG